MMKSNFLNLPSSAFGDARRHVPFRSIINKHIYIIFVLVFVFSLKFSLSYQVEASMSSIPVSSNWQYGQALDAYNSLTDSQKDIANFLAGSQGYIYAGLSNHNLNSSFSSYSDTIDAIKNFGSKMFNELNESFTGASLKNDLSNFFGSAVSYAKSRSESFQAWLGNVGIDYNSSSSFRIQFGKDQSENNTDFYGTNGLYVWQRSSVYLDPRLISFVYKSTSMNSSQSNTYNDLLLNISVPHVRFNNSWNYGYNSLTGGDFFSTYKYIFVNTSTNYAYLCDANGNAAPSSFNSLSLMFGTYNHSAFTINYTFNVQQVNISGYQSLLSIYDAISAGAINFIYSIAGNNSCNFAYCDFIESLYVGSSWNDKALWSSDYDLNLNNNSQYVTINSPTNIIYIDLNGFIKDLYDNPSSIIDYVIDNTVDDNGDPVTISDFQPVSKYPSLPDSGIFITSGLFSPLSKDGGYINYLWYMTKPLVQYTSDLVQTLVFPDDTGQGFDATGPGVIVFGVISLGLIGGLVVKCLL